MIDFDFVLLPFLLFLSAFFSASETSMFSLSSIKIEDFKRKYPTRGRIIASLLSTPQKLLVTILICNTTVNILATLTASNIFSKYFPFANYIFVVITMTLLVLIFGEVTPKSLAIKLAPKISLLVSPILFFLSILFTPLIFIFRSVSKFLVLLSSILFFRNCTEESDYKSDEIIEVIRQGQKEGAINKEEGIILKNIVTFTDSDVHKIMRPRKDIFYLSVDCIICDVISKIKEKKYSRIPVFLNSEDNIIGVLNVRDLNKVNIISKKKLLYYRDLFQKPFFVPETMKVDVLLKNFQDTKNHLALVIDEYGGISGLVTMEDVIESIIGDVIDRDDIVPLFHRYNSYMIEFDGKVEIDEFNTIFKTNIKSKEAVTLAGFILERLKRIPSGGEMLKIDNLQFKIVRALPNKIEKVLVTKIRKIKKDKELFGIKSEGET